MKKTSYFLCAILIFVCQNATSQTISLWLFDEPTGLYPSSVLENSSENDYPLVLGLGGKVVPGKFGHALAVVPPPELDLPEGEARFGLQELPPPPGRAVPPLTWMNAHFSALMTMGENHLRKEVGFVNPTDCDLNLGAFDWTVEFWLNLQAPGEEEGVVFEIGSGPRGENDVVTRLSLTVDQRAFVLVNQPAALRLQIPTALKRGAWQHVAFVYAAAEKQLRHYVDGKLQPLPKRGDLAGLPHGEEAYMSVGRDGLWQRPLPGVLDELRFSKGVVYRNEFTPPGTFAPSLPQVELQAGPPLLFAEDTDPNEPLQLGGRKHVFIDDAFLAEVEQGVQFVVNPPRKAERVIDQIQGPFRKHLTVVEDENGLIRIYNSIHKDYLAVRVSKDGVHFEVPEVGHGVIEGQTNIVIPHNVGGLGNPFIDPNGPASDRWKYFSDYNRRGIYLFTSPDGYTWRRVKTAILPFRSGTQSCTFYDDQRRRYVSYHRSGIFHTPGGATQRSSVVTEHEDFYTPVEFQPLSQEEYLELDKTLPLRDPLPWYLDNGPLTPGGFGMEFPHKFDPGPEDPVGTDFYITKAQKYPWAPDTYVAFPIAYFHYEMDGPATRQILMDPARGRGSGPLETQIAVSRDGLNWKRYPQPAYVGIGEHAGREVKTAYLAHGMVRRGDEIWQYYFGETQYHSAWKRDPAGRAVYRLVQRLDGFVSLDSPYDREVTVITKPFVFEGNRLTLNIDTDAVGYTQVGFLDERGQSIPGFSVDECVYINGDFIRTEVEWIKNLEELGEVHVQPEEAEAFAKRVVSSADVSELQGRTVQLVFRMRGTKLYAMQFVHK